VTQLLPVEETTETKEKRIMETTTRMMMEKKIVKARIQ
jgi:hypothetical protein